MPKIPKWAADTMETLFSGMLRTVMVSDIVSLHPTIKKITFKGDFKDVRFKTGQAISIRVNDTNFRNYTPSYWNSNEGICEVIVHIHGQGPGSDYLSGLTLQRKLLIGLPRGFDFYKKDFKYHFFFGDETTLGFFKSLKHVIETHDQNYMGVLELQTTSLDSTIDFGCLMDVVPSSPNKAEHAVTYLDGLPHSVWELWKTGAFYLLGNARSIQNFRKALKSKGVSSRQIMTQPYWMEGKIGL